MIPVVADADTLFGATTRGLLIHLDYQGLIRLHWSPLILDELSRALVHPDFNLVGLRAHHRRAGRGHGPVFLFNGLHGIGLGIGLAAHEDGRVAGALQGPVAQCLQQGLIRRMAHRRRSCRARRISRPLRCRNSGLTTTRPSNLRAIQSAAFSVSPMSRKAWSTSRGG